MAARPAWGGGASERERRIHRASGTFHEQRGRPTLIAEARWFSMWRRFWRAGVGLGLWEGRSCSGIKGTVRRMVRWLLAVTRAGGEDGLNYLTQSVRAARGCVQARWGHICGRRPGFLLCVAANSPASIAHLQPPALELTRWVVENAPAYVLHAQRGRHGCAMLREAPGSRESHERERGERER